MNNSGKNQPIPQRVLDRFFASIKMQPNGCWLSDLGVNELGYAQFNWRDETGQKYMINGQQMACRLKLARCYVLADGLECHHYCGTRNCVNPLHIEAMPRALHTALHGRMP